MPLLNICTISGNYMVIQVGLAFLSGEKEKDYDWAIDYILDIMAGHSIDLFLVWQLRLSFWYLGL